MTATHNRSPYNFHMPLAFLPHTLPPPIISITHQSGAFFHWSNVITQSSRLAYGWCLVLHILWALSNMEWHAFVIIISHGIILLPRKSTLLHWFILGSHESYCYENFAFLKMSPSENGPHAALQAGFFCWGMHICISSMSFCDWIAHFFLMQNNI